MDLVEFLRARLDEREQQIRAAVGTLTGATLTWGGVTVWSADDALAGIETKRRIIELHEGSHECSTYDHNGEIDNCTWVLDDCSTLRLLGQRDAEHPDYQPEWKP